MITWCSCSKQDYVTRQVNTELTFQGNYLWVCASCCLPHRLVWEGYVRRCRSCWNDRCLPWDNICQICFKEEFPGEKYKGLLHASKQAKKRLTWPLKSGKELNGILAPVGRRSLAAQGLAEEQPSKFHSRLSETI